MTRDATLDAFATGDEEADDAPAPAADTEASTEMTEEVEEPSSPPEETVENDASPVRHTTDWSSDGQECEACGTVVPRRWRQGASLVCPECKDWTEQ